MENVHDGYAWTALRRAYGMFKLGVKMSVQGPFIDKV
jgi:hypothetical protein